MELRIDRVSKQYKNKIAVDRLSATLHAGVTGLLSQLRYLTPAQVLINSSMADPRLFRVFGLVLTPMQSANVLFLLVTAVLVAAVGNLYRQQ